jgi:hypothetical protein
VLEQSADAYDGWEETDMAWCWVMARGALPEDLNAWKPRFLSRDWYIDLSQEAGADVLTTASDFDRNLQRARRILECLAQPVPVSFPKELTLEELLKHLKRATSTPTYAGIPICVDPLGLQEAEKTMASTVKLAPGRLPLNTTLRISLAELDLAYEVRDGWLVVTSSEAEIQRTFSGIELLTDSANIPFWLSGREGKTVGRIGVGRNALGPVMRAVPVDGAVAYRSGRYNSAIFRLSDDNHRNGGLEPINCSFMAMAQHRVGHRDEARRWLDRLRNRQPNTDPNEFWNELAIRLMLSEAEAVILYDPIFPLDPFAR